MEIVLYHTENLFLLSTTYFFFFSKHFSLYAIKNRCSKKYYCMLNIFLCKKNMLIKSNNYM